MLDKEKPTASAAADGDDDDAAPMDVDNGDNGDNGDDAGTAAAAAAAAGAPQPKLKGLNNVLMQLRKVRRRRRRPSTRVAHDPACCHSTRGGGAHEPRAPRRARRDARGTQHTPCGCGVSSDRRVARLRHPSS